MSEGNPKGHTPEANQTHTGNAENTTPGEKGNLPRRKTLLDKRPIKIMSEATRRAFFGEKPDPLNRRKDQW